MFWDDINNRATDFKVRCIGVTHDIAMSLLREQSRHAVSDKDRFAPFSSNKPCYSDLVTPSTQSQVVTCKNDRLPCITRIHTGEKCTLNPSGMWVVLNARCFLTLNIMPCCHTKQNSPCM